MSFIQKLRSSPRLRYALAVLTGLLFAALSKYSEHFVPVVFGILAFALIALLTILLVPAMIFSGYVVMRSLVLVSGGLSLIIFLAQAYCTLPNPPDGGKQALMALVAASFAYLAFEFSKQLWEAWRETFKPIHEQEKSWEKTAVIIILVICAVALVSIILQVIAPITASLCIYQ